MTATYNPATNRPDGGNYDANGNAPIGSWSVENRLLSQTLDGTAVNWGYDAGGTRIMKYTGAGSQATWLFYLYDTAGRKIGQVSCSNYGNTCASDSTEVYFAGRLIARGQVWTQQGGNWVLNTTSAGVVTDRLGSVRAYQQANGAWASISYYGYGEEKSTLTPDGKGKYATYLRDSSTGLGQDYAMQRYYSEGLGRFYSPDPKGFGAASQRNPQSFNLFNYVTGDPVNFFDPSGASKEGPSNPSACPAQYTLEDCLEMRARGIDPSDPAGGGSAICSSSAGNAFAPGPGPASPACGGGGPVVASAPPDPPSAPTITLRQVDSCALSHGTGMNPGVWTLAVKYQVMVDGAQVLGVNSLNQLGISISESVAKTGGNIDYGRGVWCPAGGNCGAAAGSMFPDGSFWDLLGGSGTADQTFMFQGQPVQVTFSGGNAQTVLKNRYDSANHTVSVGNGALVGNSNTRECSKNGEPSPR